MPISSGKVVDSTEIGLRVSVLQYVGLDWKKKEKEALLYCNCSNET
jgi:hypothetical protein